MRGRMTRAAAATPGLAVSAGFPGLQPDGHARPRGAQGVLNPGGRMAISRRRLLTMPPKLHAFALLAGFQPLTAMSADGRISRGTGPMIHLPTNLAESICRGPERVSS